MPDPTYQPLVYRKQGGNELVVASGGAITVESGGALSVDGADFAAILAAIPTADPEDGVTVWLDGGVLKVASGP